MLDVSSSSVETQLGADFAKIYSGSTLYRKNEDLNKEEGQRRIKTRMEFLAFLPVPKTNCIEELPSKLIYIVRNSKKVEAEMVTLKMSYLKKLNQGSDIVILDSYSDTAKTVAKALTKIGFKNCWIVNDGFSGGKGWLQSRLGTDPYNLSFAEVISPSRIVPAAARRFGTSSTSLAKLLTRDGYTGGKIVFEVSDLQQQCLPITIDVGTNNEKLLNDEFYIGPEQKRATGKEYYDFLHKFMSTVKQNYGEKVLIQFEDYNDFELLAKYGTTHLVFNDDIQGTTSVSFCRD